MKVYVTTDFEGHFPTGTAAVITARDKRHATNLLKKEVEKCGLEFKIVQGDKFGRPQLIEINQDESNAIVLQDGNY